MKNTKPSIFIDLDNTILDFTKAERLALTKTLHDLNIEPNEEMMSLYSQINIEQWERLERGEADRDEILTRRFILFFEALGIKEEGFKAEKIYEEYLCQGHFFIEGAEETLESLYKDCDLFIASNGIDFVQERRLQSAGIKKYFKNIFISENLGFNKPDKRFFLRCFETSPEISPERCLIVGDSLTSDILGGINAGIKTVWFNPNKIERRKDIVPDYEIYSLSQLPNLIHSIFQEHKK